jgi:phage repressor protein C with HTH and peptisase S24 domain
MGWANHYIEKLRKGETVKFRPHGNSMQPKIESGQLCTVEPLGTPPEPGDAVLCTVEGRQFLHLVTAVRGPQFQISNNKGHVNGWCTIRQIHGKLVKVEP